jgi:hypothetical protein
MATGIPADILTEVNETKEEATLYKLKPRTLGRIFLGGRGYFSLL